MEQSPFLIVGSGPTGLTMAIELKRAGLDVRVIDKAVHQAQHSQALVVQARTLEQFQRCGIASRAVEEGRKLTGIQFFSDGKKIVDVDFKFISSRYPFILFLPQNKTEAILSDFMESLGVTTERGTELIAMKPQGDKHSCQLSHPDGSEEWITPSYVIGCDGAHSPVREFLSIPFEGAGVDLNFFLGDLELDGPDAPGDHLTLHLHAGDVIFMGRLTDKLTRLIVALHAEPPAQNDRQLTIADFQSALDRAKVRAKIRSADWMTPFHVRDLQARHYRAGSAFVAGDAAHIHSPVGGQGMNTGIQDAANLAWKIAAVARGANEKILDSYEEERGAVGKALLRFTERGLKLATAANPIIEHLRDLLAPLFTSMKATQRSMLGFISETAIEYRSSSIVTNHGGDGALHPGDRLPDVDVTKQDKTTNLLRNWTSATHLAIPFNATKEEADEISRQLEHTETIALCDADLNDEGRRLFGTEKKLFVIRPDGYIGFKCLAEDIAELDGYALQDGLR